MQPRSKLDSLAAAQNCLSSSTSELNLGKKDKGTPFSVQVKITNTCSQIGYISVINSANWISSISPAHAEMEPRSSLTFTIKGRFPLEMKPFNTTIMFKMTPGTSSLGVRIFGEAVGPKLRVSPTEIHLGEHYLKTPFYATFTVSNVGDGSVQLRVYISETAEWLEVTPTDFSLEKGKSQTVAVSGHLPTVPGLFDTTLQVHSNDVDGQIRIDGHAHSMLGECIGFPSIIDLGAGNEGKVFGTSFTIRNLCTEGITLNVLKHASWITSVKPESLTLSAYGYQEIEIAGLFPQATEVFETWLEICLPGIESRRIRVFGVVPALEVSCEKIAFQKRYSESRFFVVPPYPAEPLTLTNRSSSTLAIKLSQTGNWVEGVWPTKFDLGAGQKRDDIVIWGRIPEEKRLDPYLANLEVTYSITNSGTFTRTVDLLCRSNEAQPRFTDVPYHHWAYNYICYLANHGFVAGKTNSKYAPDEALSRAEIAVLIVRGIKGLAYMPPEPTEQIFDDVATDTWYAKWVHELYHLGFTAGCDETGKKYCPEQKVTRAEGCVFFLRMRERDVQPQEPGTSRFSDVPVTEWFAKWVHAAYTEGLIPAYESIPELRFNPNGEITRAMAAYTMVKAKKLYATKDSEANREVTKPPVGVDFDRARPDIAWYPAVSMNLASQIRPDFPDSQYWVYVPEENVYKRASDIYGKEGSNLCGQVCVSMILETIARQKYLLVPIIEATSVDPDAGTTSAQNLIDGVNKLVEQGAAPAVRCAVNWLKMEAQPFRAILIQSHPLISLVNISTGKAGKLVPRDSNGAICHWVVITGFSRCWDPEHENAPLNWIRIQNPFCNHTEYYPWSEFLLSVQNNVAEIWEE